MPIFEINGTELVAVEETSFDAEGIYERRHIQQLLRDHIEALDSDLMVVAEEFHDWLDSSRSIDLLCLDAEANLVVVELKRTEDGGHMELQAIRYAAMVSAMTFAQLVEAHARFKNKAKPDLDEAQSAILQFLGWDSPDEEQFGQDVRIILAAADFGKELTTAVLWLIDRGIDIRCLRLRPYKMEPGRLLLDIHQIIPPPDTASFQTKIGVKRASIRESQAERYEARLRFWERLLRCAKDRTSIHANRQPTTGGSISGPSGRSGFTFNYVVREEEARVELYIAQGSGMGDLNKAAFWQLREQEDAINEEFGGTLEWQELPNRAASRIRYVIDGGYKSPEDSWDHVHAEMVDAMIRLEKALGHRVAELRV